jgi:quercetin dioxygenase-like cupin family protein
MDKEWEVSSGQGTVVRMAGQGVTYRIVGEQTGGTLALVEVTLGPGLLGTPPHMHRNEDEVSCVLEGELMVRVGERVVRATPGEVVFKPRGVFHAYWNSGATPARILEFITPAGFEEYFREVAPCFPVDGPPDVPAIVALARQYDVEFDLSRLAEILEEYQVKAAWLEEGQTEDLHGSKGGSTVSEADYRPHSGTSSTWLAGPNPLSCRLNRSAP